jgi:predicted AAA+ superfamily ATPase
MSAPSPWSFRRARREADFWGRLVETAVGAHLLNSAAGTKIEVFYWRERGLEVDFVLRLGRTVVAVEVKSGRRREGLPGMEAFCKAFKPLRRLLVGEGGIPLEAWLSRPVIRWIGEE